MDLPDTEGNIINIYQGSSGIIKDDVLSQLIALITQSNLKLELMGQTLSDLTTQVTDLKTTLTDAVSKNATYVKTLEDANTALTSTNDQLKAKLDEAAKGGTVLDTETIAAISTQLDSIKSIVTTGIATGATATTIPVTDPTPTTTTTTDTTPPATTTTSGDTTTPASTDTTTTTTGTTDTTTTTPATSDTTSTTTPADGTTDPNAKPW